MPHRRAATGRRIRCTPISCWPATPKVPIIYEVDRIRDGKSFTTRRVVAIQHGQCDLHHDGVVPSPGARPDRHQARMPNVPTPEDLPTEAEITEARAAADAGAGAALATSANGRSSCGRSSSTAISARASRTAAFMSGSAPPASCRTSRRSTNACWPMRPDMTLLDRRADPARPQPCSNKTSWRASLDHALWFHRPFRADEWVLYAQDSPNMSRRPRLCPRPDFRPRRHAGRRRWPRKACCASERPDQDRDAVRVAVVSLLIGIGDLSPKRRQ